MLTFEKVCSSVNSVIEQEREHSLRLHDSAREDRLRKMREIELTSRLRHAIGGLDTYMSAQGPDIQSESPRGDIEVKLPGYWHNDMDKPQPLACKQIEKDLSWMLASAAISRFFVLFLPQRLPGYGVPKAGGDFAHGRRRFQHCFSASDDVLAQNHHTQHLFDILSEVVWHRTTKNTLSPYRQYQNKPRYTTPENSRFILNTVGLPDTDLIWALVLAPSDSAH